MHMPPSLKKCTAARMLLFQRAKGQPLKPVLELRYLSSQLQQQAILPLSELTMVALDMMRPVWHDFDYLLLCQVHCVVR